MREKTRRKHPTTTQRARRIKRQMAYGPLLVVWMLCAPAREIPRIRKKLKSAYSDEWLERRIRVIPRTRKDFVVLLMLLFGCSHAVFFAFAPIHAELNLLAQSDDIRKYDLAKQHNVTASIAQISMLVGILPSVLVLGLASMPTYGIEKWPRRLWKNSGALILLSSLWMRESKLTEYYYRIHGFGSKPPRSRLPLTGNVAHMIPDSFTSNW